MQMNATLYYRSKLSPNDQKIYDDLMKQWMHFDKVISVGTPKAAFNQVTQAIHFDCPLLFYVNYYQIKYMRSLLGLRIYGDYLYGKEEAKGLLDRCEKWGTYIINHMPPKLGIAEKALWLHDVILNNVKYGDSNGIRAHNMIGVVCDGIAVCEGISMAYKFLCDLAGIPCMYVSGTLDGGPHGWNMIWINGKASFVDVTNDINAHGGYDRINFLRSSKEMIGYSWDEQLVPEGCLTNKKNRCETAHNTKELFTVIRKMGDCESMSIHLEYDHKLTKEEIQKVITQISILNPLMALLKISYAVDQQMIYIQK